MNFVHATLLAGAAFAILPVLLHMLSKKQPKQLVFPALRFVRETAVVSQRGWKVKHWLLLAMRVLMVLLLAGLLAAPHVHSAMLATYVMLGLLGVFAVLAVVVAVVAFAARKSAVVIATTSLVAFGLTSGVGVWGYLAFAKGVAAPTPNASGPIAVALVIDNSPSMGYQSQNQTRLEAAKEMGQWIIERMPTGSQFVVVSGASGARLSQDRAAAQRQLERIEASGVASNLPNRIKTAVELVRASELERREVYVVTDLMESAWKNSSQANLVETMATEPEILLQIVDVGVEEMSDWSITGIELSQQSVLPGSNVNITAQVRASANTNNDQLIVELVQEKIDITLPVRRGEEIVTPEERLIDRHVVEPAPGSSMRVEFQLRDLPLGVNHAKLRLQRPDPLMVNNEVYVAIDVRPQSQVLVVSSNQVLGEVIQAMIAPDDFDATPESRLTSLTDYFRLDTLEVNDYAAIVLFDPTGLNTATVEKLDAFVANGGGLMILLGGRFGSAEALAATSLARLLPGEVPRIMRRSLDDRSLSLSPTQINHPVFHVFGQAADSVAWERYAVYKYWEIENVAEGAGSLMRYTITGQPAMIEQVRGQGRIITFTTPIPEPAAPEGRRPWNDLFSGSDYAWECFALVSGAMRYLSGWGKNEVNFVVGQPASLENDEAVYPDRYELFTPNGEVLRVQSIRGSVNFANTDQAGTYRLRGLRDEKPFVRGFVSNLNPEDVLLKRTDASFLNGVLGENKFLIARTTDELTSSIGTARYGRELYPFLLTALLFLWLAEQAMSTRFYSIRLSPGAKR